MNKDTSHTSGAGTSSDPIQSAISDINTEFKEREVQQYARDLGISYVDISIIPINDDLLRVISQEESEKMQMIAFFQVGKKIRVAMVNPDNTSAKKKIKQLTADGYSININICSPEKLTIAQRAYKRIKKAQTKAADLRKLDLEEADNIANEIETLLDIPNRFKEIQSDLALAILNRKAIALNASDIHFEWTKEGVRVRGRRDGILSDFFLLSHQIAKGIIRQIKFNAKILSNIKDVPQDGQFVFPVSNREVMVRVSVLPESHGESIVMRYLDPQKQNLKIESLGMIPEHLEEIKKLLKERNGFIVVTGPTGSGKTTTMYSMLNHINTPDKKIITLEDPVEYTLKGIVQSSINTEKGYSFSAGIKACLRQDPDIILLGEIRDTETAETALQAAITGHLVLSTLHTNSAIETLTRIKDLDIPQYLIANALNGIIAQRLLRTVCPHCVHQVNLSPEEKNTLMRTLSPYIQAGKKLPHFSGKMSEGKGCKKCGYTGYKGRTAINEVITISPEIQEMIYSGTNEGEIKKFLIKNNQIFFPYNASIKILEGSTDYKEVVRVLGKTFIDY